MTESRNFKPCIHKTSSNLKEVVLIPIGVKRRYLSLKTISTSKSRLTYDNLSMAKWVSGFCAIIRDESNVQTKNNMLNYVADLMKDCHDFGWQSAKEAHTVVLCHMEENKVNWDETNKLDRLRRVHAQRTPNSNTSLGQIQR